MKANTRVIRTIDGSIGGDKHRCQVMLSKYRPDVPSGRLQAWDFIVMTVQKVSTSQMYGDVRSTKCIAMSPLQHTQRFVYLVMIITVMALSQAKALRSASVRPI